MGRIRTIKPEFFTDEDLSTVSEPAHLLAAGLLCYADDEGYFNANHALIRAALFPLREPSNTIHGMLSELSNIGFIECGETQDGKRWGRVEKFSTHQRVNRPTPSKIKHLAITWEISLSAHSGTNEASLSPHTHLTEDSMPEGKGKEGKGNAPAAPAPLSAPLDCAPVAAAPESLEPLPWDADPVENIPDGLGGIQYAIFALSALGVEGATYTLKIQTSDVIAAIAKEEACGLHEATKRLIGRMRLALQRGPVKWNFWLQDGHWRGGTLDPADAEREAFLAGGTR